MQSYSSTSKVVYTLCLFVGFSSLVLTKSLRAENPFRLHPFARSFSTYPSRTWTDIKGEYKIEARYVSANKFNALLLKKDNTVVMVPLSKLSEKDQGYIEGVLAAKPARPDMRNRKSKPNPSQTVLPPIAADTIDQVDRLELKLPGIVRDVSRAAGGKLLLLHMPEIKTVAVYDAAQTKITKYLSLNSDTTMIVGGLSKMIVVAPNERLIERWSLKTFKKELTRTLPFNGVFKTMALGYSSDGPLLIHSAASTDALAPAGYHLVDTRDLKAFNLKIRARNNSYRDRVHIRASGTGNMFALWASSHSPQGMESINMLPSQVVVRYQHSTCGHLVPNIDGSAVMTATAGVCTPELVHKQQTLTQRPLVPSTHARFYVGVSMEPEVRPGSRKNPNKSAASTLHLLSQKAPLINLPPLELGFDKDYKYYSREQFSLDKRVHYLFAANQIVSIPISNDMLIVNKFHLEQVLKEKNIDYLYVKSVPQRIVKRGMDYRYNVECATSGGMPKYELNIGPENMSIGPGGMLQWKVPADFSEPKTNVVVSISTPDGQNIYETFYLRCADCN